MGRLVAALAAAALATALLAAGCSRKEPITGPQPVLPGEVRVEGNRVLWTTPEPARGWVRYGYTAPRGNPPRFEFDHAAYPDAAGRGDRATRREHNVAFLDVRPGATVYFQVVSEAPGAPTGTSAPDSFVAAGSSVRELLTATMIHIGFGDSHLLRMPTTGKLFVIDCGYRDADASVETYLQDHGVTAVDAMLATHVHEDHLGGVVGSRNVTTDGILNRFPPPVFFDSPLKSANSLGKPAYRELLNSIPAATSRLILNRGDTSVNRPELQLDPEVRIRCLNSGTPPDYVPVGYEGTNINNESMVLLFSYGDVDFVIGGDAEEACEASMLAANQGLQVEYYKATHHGLSDANSAAWVNALKPRVAFIPNTRLVWDPPSEFEDAIASTVSKLEGVGAHIYVIDEAETLERYRSSGRQYNVTFATDGRSYEVRVEPATQAVPAKTAQSFGCVQHALHGHGAEHAPAVP